MERTKVSPRNALSSIKPYTSGKPIWEVQQELGVKRVIKLASNENPLGASPKAKEAMQSILTDIHRYPDASAIFLKESIASVYEVPVESVIVSNGADELIKFISETYLEMGDEIVIPEPTFTEYKFGAHLMGANVIRVPLGSDYQYNAQALLEAISPDTKLIYLCSPNNPTGTYLNKTEMETFFKALPKGILVVLDAAYSHYAVDKDYSNGLSFMKEGYPVIVLQTFSKVYGMAGLRVGFGIASADIIQDIEKVREPFNVNALAQAAAVAALKDTKHLECSRNCVVKGRHLLYRVFDELGLSYTQSASNFILVKFGCQAESIYFELLQMGIIVRRGELWERPNHLRITVGTKEEIQIFEQALKQIMR